MRAFSRAYGSSPLHLAVAGGAFLIAVYAGYRALQKGPVLSQGEWFLGAILLHDMVLIPVYSAVLVGLLYLVGGRAARDGTPLPRVRLLVLNHLRVPAGLALLLLLVFFPLVFGLSEGGLEGVSGLSTEPYLARYLFLTLGLFAVSAAVLAVRLALGRKRSAAPRQESD
jgi:hypothetical protein